MNILKLLSSLCNGVGRKIAGMSGLLLLLAGPGRGQGVGLPDQSPGPVSPSALGPRAPAYEVMNALLGLPLLADDNLWGDTPAEVAARLKLPAEGMTDHFASYRAYPRQPVAVLGVRSYMLSLKAAEGRLTAFSVMFTNRGDFPAFAKLVAPAEPDPGQINAFEDAMRSDFQTLSARITARFGPSHRASLSGGTLASGPAALRWSAAGCVLLLSQVPLQMVTLKIVPDESAKETRLSTAQLRLKLKSLVTRRPNGDVILDQVPMVNQGPKGYCVPATFERCLRYFDIPADMYELAAVGGTDYGGGTNPVAMAAGLDLYVHQHGRVLERADAEVSITGLARYLDEGRPVIWTLDYTKTFNTLVNTHTKARAATTDWTKWRQTVLTAAKTPLEHDKLSGHACLIIGYNRATNEIALTDSWGPGYAECWVPVTAAMKVSRDQFWVVSW